MDATSLTGFHCFSALYVVFQRAEERSAAECLGLTADRSVTSGCRRGSGWWA